MHDCVDYRRGRRCLQRGLYVEVGERAAELEDWLLNLP
jgi:hypothetical protein